MLRQGALNSVNILTFINEHCNTQCMICVGTRNNGLGTLHHCTLCNKHQCKRRKSVFPVPLQYHTTSTNRQARHYTYRHRSSALSWEYSNSDQLYCVPTFCLALTLSNLYWVQSICCPCTQPLTRRSAAECFFPGDLSLATY